MFFEGRGVAKGLNFSFFFIIYPSSAQIISNLGEKIINELNTCWPILIERLKNEITRLTTVKAIQVIAE